MSTNGNDAAGFEPITVTSGFEPIDSQQLSPGNVSTVEAWALPDRPNYHGRNRAVGGLGSLQFERSTTRMQTGAAALNYAIIGNMSIAWSFECGRNKGLGVPGSLACAVLLQTDDIPFEISVEFAAPLLRSLYRAKPKIVIRENHLWERRGRDPWEAALEWGDFDSDAFGDWIQRKTRNGWAEWLPIRERRDGKPRKVLS
ncbi:hypothetical protein C8A03DRAFT_35615 [Achaetomium macrosporum]|uniref:Uncharacterized protein n=1 Tax=Achaetomium macrosporum TaxID=79813 RepID=A0AAN7H9I1_9PEZI|nr:hypothetical protein C8A03DRAFT_35615 [Achaetomium macrosporum]